jgi:hypothetical protein
MFSLYSDSDLDEMFLPYSDSDFDEFRMPNGEIYYVLRSIVYDSWLTWKDALPELTEQRTLLDQETVDNITKLGSSLHSFHQSLPDYRPLTRTPFKVTRWWDPEDRDERWNGGSACLFSMTDYSATDLVRLIQKKTELAVTPVSKRYVEAYLPDS